jgi:3'(2'), 5'-bisphosphate nucleotidase
MPAKDRINMDSLLIEAIIAAITAGEAVLEIYGSGFSVQQKEDRSPLTLADKRSHEAIDDKLKSGQAGRLPILSEEGRNIPFEERKAWEYYWLVDPLDGTKEFIRRNGEFTVNIALIRNDRPVMGVVLLPVKDILYFAAEGTGAFKLSGTSKIKNGIRLEDIKREAIRLTAKSKTAKRPYTVIASRSHMSDETSSFIDAIRNEYGEIEIIPAGSSLKFCLVAEGTADVYPRFGPTMEWDTAAGQAVVELAGGTVLNHETDLPLRYNRENLLNPWFIVRGPDLHQR